MNQLVEDAEVIAQWWLTESKWADELWSICPKFRKQVFCFQELMENDPRDIIMNFYYDYIHSDGLVEIADEIRELSNYQIEMDEIDGVFHDALNRVSKEIGFIGSK